MSLLPRMPCPAHTLRACCALEKAITRTAHTEYTLTSKSRRKLSHRRDSYQRYEPSQANLHARPSTTRNTEMSQRPYPRLTSSTYECRRHIGMEYSSTLPEVFH